jgi:hypothetical protein
VVPYINARAIMDRLDAVVGPENWRNHIEAISGGFLQSIDIRIDGEWVCRVDGAQITDIESIKGGISGALKRAAVLWGIGRYLYDIEGNLFANVHDNGAHYQPAAKDGKYPAFKWDPPRLPEWALPKKGPGIGPPPVPSSPSSANEPVRVPNGVAAIEPDTQEDEQVQQMKADLVALVIKCTKYLSDNRAYLAEVEDYVVEKTKQAKNLAERQDVSNALLAQAYSQVEQMYERMEKKVAEERERVSA